MDAGLAATRDTAIRGHLAVSTLNTYQTGLTAWDQFADQYKIPLDLFQLDQLAILMTVEFFACHLRRQRHIKSTTIDKYITHLSTSLREKGLPDSSNLRCKRLGYILESFAKEDAQAIPQRLSIKIPLTADLLWRLEIFIDKLFPNSPIATLYKAAFSLGYLIGLRPGEYLCTPTRRLHSRLLRDNDDVIDEHCANPSSHVISGRHCAFKWSSSDSLFTATNPLAYPHGRPEAVFIMLPSSKADQLGKGSARCGASSPKGSRFDCLSNIYQFLLRYPPLLAQPLLSGFTGSNVTSADVNRILKDFARSIDLDPNRLLPHSIRVGTSVQTDALSDIDQMQLTGHISKGGKLAYCRRTLALAKRAAPFLHDTAVQPLDQIRFLYM